MHELLKKLGFTQKETAVYLNLLKLGNQPASTMAKKLKMPRATALFILENLTKRGYLLKSKKGRTQYYFADPLELKKAKLKQLESEREALEEVTPMLENFKNPYTKPPKITFFEGIDGCKKAYNTLLTSQTEIREFATHLDLEKMGINFMADFIEKRAKNGVFMKDICVDNKVHRDFKNKDKEHLRDSKLYDPKIGTFYSSISVYENKTVILNLYNDPFAIIIESEQVAETMNTIHKLARGEN
jgi:sugar-specific transcriptional regulator TrmB